MKRFLLVMIAGSALWAADPATYKTAADLAAVLKENIRKVGPEMAESPVVAAGKYQVNVVHRDKPGGALAHPEGTEVHYIMDGGGTFVTGGKIAGKGAAAIIEGGVTRHVAKGDVVVIPAGLPHWYSQIDAGAITYLETRFNVETTGK